LDGQIWALKADSLTSPLIVTVTVTVTVIRVGVRHSETAPFQGALTPRSPTNTYIL